MKVKLFTLLNSKPVLQKMGNSKDYDGATSYKIARNISVVNPEFVNFDKAETELFRKYGEKVLDAEGKEADMKILPANIDLATKERVEIVESEFDLDILLINPEKLTGLSPLEMMAIDWMLKLE